MTQAMMHLLLEQIQKATLKEIPEKVEEYHGWQYRAMLRIRSVGFP